MSLGTGSQSLYVYSMPRNMSNGLSKWLEMHVLKHYMGAA